MEHAQREAYDATRDFSRVGFRSACYAPHTSMYLDPRGDVRACCQNVQHVLGNVTVTRLPEIWSGAPAEELRAALVDYDLSLGCRFCQWQIDDGNERGVFARDFDLLPLSAPEPTWPQRLEFALSNTCNLECVMCDGELSSMIRSRREHRPPLPRVYDDQFFEDLRPFLAHLSEARFLGGEPFLAAESFRVWDLMIEDGLRTPCRVTTNGTHWNKRVERVLDAFPVSIAVSLDGVSATTFEAIRVRASHDGVQANWKRFRDYTTARGTDLEISFCLMQENWSEFGDMLAFGDTWGARVNLNTVIHPDHGLYQLPLDEFDVVLASLERRDRKLRRKLALNRDVWIGELARLRHWRDTSRAAGEARTLYFHRSIEPATDEVPVHLGAMASTDAAENGVGAAPAPAPADDGDAAPLPAALRHSDPTCDPTCDPTITLVEAGRRVIEGMATDHVSVLRCDRDDVVAEVGGDGASFLGIDAAVCVGRPFAHVAGLVASSLGEPVTAIDDRHLGGGAFRRLVYGDPASTCHFVQVLSFPRWSNGEFDGSTTVAARSSEAPAWASGDDG